MSTDPTLSDALSDASKGRTTDPALPAATVGLVACLVVIVGSLMTWANVTTTDDKISFSGFDAADGKITVVAAMASAVMIFAAVTWQQRRRTLLGLSALAAFVVSGTATYDTIEIAHHASNLNVTGVVLSANVGIGLWIVNVACVAMLVSIYRVLRREPEVVLMRLATEDVTYDDDAPVTKTIRIRNVALPRQRSKTHDDEAAMSKADSASGHDVEA